MRHIGERLAEVMLMRGVTPAKMAKALNLGKGHVSNIMTGRIQSPKKHLPAIAAYLQVSQAWLLTGEGTPEVAPCTEIAIYRGRYHPDHFLGHETVSVRMEPTCYGLIEVDTLPPEILIVIAPNLGGDGLYLVQTQDNVIRLAQRVDCVTHLAWRYLSQTQTQAQTTIFSETPSVIGKIKTLIHKENKNEEIKNCSIR